MLFRSLKLSMKLSDIEFQGDGKKATFFYTADDRVDFRELIKKLAEEFKIRVEMRQIGMRQEASRLGGIGVCGRELCCSTWLTDFKTVSTSTARYQNLALNPAKLAGQCTKLKCCLNYELDSYMDALKDLPSTSVILETEKGRAFHRKTDIFKRLMWYAFSIDEKREQSELIEGGVGGNWVVLPIDRVNEIIELNKQKIKPTDLALPEDEEEEEYEPDYENVVGQDSIYRMDKPKKKKKKKKKPALTTATGETATATAGVPNQNRPQQNRPQQQRSTQQPSGDRPQQTSERPQQQRPPQQQGGDRPLQSRPPQQQGGGQQQNRPQQPRNPQQNQGKPQQQNPRPQQSRPSPTPRPENTESKPQEPPAAKPPTPSQPAAPQPPRNPNRPQRIPRPDSPAGGAEPNI